MVRTRERSSLEHSILCQNTVVGSHDGLVVPQEDLRVLHVLVGALYEVHGYQVGSQIDGYTE